MRRVFVVLALIGLMVLPLKAQRLWIETEASKEFWDVLEVSLSPELRFDEDFEVKQYFIQPAVEYSFNKYLKLGAGFRLGNNIKNSGDTEFFRRYHLNVQTGFKWNNFNPTFRLRYTNADDFGDDNPATNYLRYRLKLKFKVKKLDTTPYVLYEWYRDTEEQEFTKSRFEGGLQYKLNDHHKIGAYYRVNNYLDGSKDNRSIIGVSYKYKL